VSVADRAGVPVAPTSGRASPRRKPRRPAARRVLMGDREILTHGLPRRFWQDLYHRCMTISWPGLFAALGAFFIVLNIGFGSLYALMPGCIANLNPPGWLGSFFFSIETSATVGYGDMHPQTVFGHAVASVEMFVGLLSIALITGVMFARFSTPRARVMFARYAVMRPLDGQPTLMMRVANARQNMIVEASARLRLVREEVTSEGFKIRRIRDLALVREQTSVFVLSWTIMHVIDETSPLAGESSESLAAAQGQLVLSIIGTDETTGQNVTARTQYRPHSLRWNHTFRDILGVDEDGHEVVDYTHFHEIVPLAPAAGS
jgi:inward rectifier potassium channel